MNKLDKDYQELVKDILNNGYNKGDRTGTGTKSVFGKQIRHKMSDGFPLLTTKKMAWKSMVTELIWFLNGDTNIKYLVDNGCNIWNGDAIKNWISSGKCYHIKQSIYIEPKFKIISIEETTINDFPSINSNGFWRWEEEGIDNLLIDFSKFSGEYKNIREIIDDAFSHKIKTDDEFAKKWGELGPIYGKQWRKWGTNKLESFSGVDYDGCKPIYIDQIQNSINLLKTDPDSRRNIVSAWNVGEMKDMVLPPCHNFFQFYTRELSLEDRIGYMILNNLDTSYMNSLNDVDRIKWMDKNNIPKREVSLMFNMRSVDTGLGLPFNIASYGLLLEIVAKMVNMVPGELIGKLGDTHLYNDHLEPIQEQLDRKPYPLPKLIFGKTDNFFNVLSEDLSLFSYLTSKDFSLENYQSHDKIILPLSN